MVDAANRIPALVGAALLAVTVATPGLVADETARQDPVASNATDQLSLETITPSAAGIRYGQAAGVALVCYGLKTTGKAELLKNKFPEGSGARASFEAEASRTLAAWQDTLNCTNAGGPNECKLSHVWSCQQALREIGPAGTVLPDLVVQKSQ